MYISIYTCVYRRSNFQKEISNETDLVKYITLIEFLRNRVQSSSSKAHYYSLLLTNKGLFIK